MENQNKTTTFSDEETEYLWSKIEWRKKKKAIDNQNPLYVLFNSNKKDFNVAEIEKIHKSLEYSFKKKLKNNELKSDLGKSIFLKIN